MVDNRNRRFRRRVRLNKIVAFVGLCPACGSVVAAALLPPLAIDSEREGKAAFRSERLAKKRMRQPWQDFDEGMTAYLCAYCHAWHVGHVDEVDGKRRKGKKARN